MSESSANKSENMTSDALARSLIYSRNNNGPAIDPCGTPRVIRYLEDNMSLYTTYCSFVLISKPLQTNTTDTQKFPFCAQNVVINSIECFEKYEKSPRTYIILHSPEHPICYHLGIIKLVLGHDRNSNWYEFDNLRLLIKDNSWLYMILSNILENTGKTETGEILGVYKLILHAPFIISFKTLCQNSKRCCCDA